MPSTILSDNGVTSNTSGIKVAGSNDGILELQTTTAGGAVTTAMTINTSQAVTFAQTANLPNTFGFKNRIINGGMVIDQRNAGASGTAAAAYTIDRWKYDATQASKGTWQQNAGSVTPPVGFTNYLGFTSSSAYSVLSADYFTFIQYIEGFNTSDLAWGTANAKTVTLSFWVRSSLTGTFGGSITNSAFNRSYPFTYTINAANTFEYKTVTIAGDTTGTWLTTNGIGVGVSFSLGTGATFSGTAGAWTGSGLISATGATSVVGTNGATFYITGVQLEVGSTATSFDYRDYGRELIMCQRYFFVAVSGSAKYWGMGQNYSASALTAYIQFPVTMRAAPTSASTTGTNYYGFYRNGTNDDFNSITLEAAQVQGTGFFNNSEISGTAGQSGNLYTNNASSFIAFQAEL
jgi:hypothetical protein